MAVLPTNGGFLHLVQQQKQVRKLRKPLKALACVKKQTCSALLDTSKILIARS